MKSLSYHSITLESKIQIIFDQVYSTRINESLSNYERLQLISGFEDTINEGIGKLLAKGANLVSSFGDRLAGGAKNAYNYVTTKSSEYYEKGKKLAGDAIESLKNFKDKLVADIVEGYNNALAKITAGYESFKNSMTLVYQNVIKNIQESYTAMKDKAEAFAEYIKGAFSEILAKISLLAQQSKEKFLAMKEGFKEWSQKNKQSILESLDEAKSIGISGLERAIMLAKNALEGGKDVLKFIGILSIVIITAPIILLIKGLKAIPGLIESAKEMISNYIQKEIEEYKEYREDGNSIVPGKLYSYTNKKGKKSIVKVLSLTNDTAMGPDKVWMTQDDEMKDGLAKGFASVLYPDKDGQYTSKSREIAINAENLEPVAENLKYLQTFERFIQRNY